MVRSSENFGGQGDDLHETLGAQFARDRSEDTSADRLEFGVEKHGCVAVKFDQRAIAATDALGGTNHHGTVDFALFDAAARRSLFDAYFDDVAHAGITTLRTAEHLDAQNGLRTGVVGDL